MSTASVAFAAEQRLGIRDLRLVERAARERWPIPDVLRGEVVDRLATIIRDATSTAREVTAAVRALISFSKINLQTVAAIAKADAHEERRRIAALEAAEPAEHNTPAPCNELPTSPHASPSEIDSDNSDPPIPMGRPHDDVPNDHELPAPPPCDEPTRPALTTANAATPANIAQPIERPQVSSPFGLEYVTHLELLAEDPAPEAPAIERRDKAWMRFRVGKDVNLWVSPPTLHPLLPPGPERDLRLNNRIQICRVDNPSRCEPD